MMLFYQPIIFASLFQMVISGGTNYDPYRWIISYQKPATLSSTEGELKASFATDGNFRVLYDANPGTNYSASLKQVTPSLQIDLGKSVPVPTIQLNAPKFTGSGSQSRIIVRVGDNPAVYSKENIKCGGMYCICQTSWIRLHCGRKGRYVNIIRDIKSNWLKIAEAAVFKRPLENLAYKKKTACSGAYSSTKEGDKAVDMQDNTLFASKFSPLNWIRVDLEDSHLIHEVLLFARDTCCIHNTDALYGFELRIGDSLANDGNSNPLCGKYDLETGEIRSFYCDMFGRYVNIIRTGLMYLAEVIINPETTENVAALADVTSNINPQGGKSLRSIVDTLRHTFITPWTEQKDDTKRITISLGTDYSVAMILIANVVEYLNELTDFKIAVGMTDAFSDSTLCVPGVQDMAGILVKSFYCTPDRILGNYVFIDQGAGKQIGISEVGVYEETRPKIVDHRTNRFIWSKEGGEVTLECDAEGYPAPVISWVKDKVVIKTGSTSLQLTNFKLNDSKVIECWANNSNGFEGRLFALEITSELRMCVKNRELQFQTGQSQTVDNHELQGNMFYRFTDAQKHSDLQFHEVSPPKTNPSCKTWLKEKHPGVNDGVVSRQLCIRDQGNDCHSTLDIYVRRCTHYYVYNFKDLRDLSQLKLCMKSAVHLQHGLRPLMTSSTRKHALSEKTFHTEENFQESYECLMLCQLDKRCKSFNFSKKLQLCELNTGTKKEFPRNLVPYKDFDHYHINRGFNKQEL